MSSYNFVIVPPGLYEYMQYDVEPLLQEVVDIAPLELSIDSIKNNVLSGNVLLIAVMKKDVIVAVLTLEIRTFDTGHKVLVVPITAGSDMVNREDGGWGLAFNQLIIQYAKDNGCVEIRGIAARRGWMRRLEPLGWKEVHTTIAYEVT